MCGLGFQAGTEWPAAEMRHCGLGWRAQSLTFGPYVGGEVWGTGCGYPNLQCLVKEPGLNSESVAEPL